MTIEISIICIVNCHFSNHTAVKSITADRRRVCMLSLPEVQFAMVQTHYLIYCTTIDPEYYKISIFQNLAL